MTEQDRRRAELYERTREVLGDEPARTLFEMFPDDDELARHDDLVSLRAHVDQVAAHVRDLDQRVEQLDRRLERLNHDMQAGFEKLGNRIALQGAQLHGDFEAGINRAITTQTRVVMLSVFGAVVAMAGTMLGAAALLVGYS